jgi:hypothetical protein
MNTVAAQRTWFAVAPDRTEHELVLRVGVPERAASGEWWSAVSLGVLQPGESRIAGIDAWQALHLAMRFVATRIEDFAAGGWQFFWERNGESALPSEFSGG